MAFFKSQTITPEMVNEHNQVTDTAVLKKDRIKFGFGTILYQSEEVGIGAVPTVIIRALGGDALHLGIYGAVNAINSVFHWVGTLFLRKFNSNRKAMLFSMVIGLFVASLIALSIFISFVPAFKPFSLWAYLILALIFAAVGGVQWNLETSWIGDLVPKDRLGWFTGLKWALGVIGIFCFSMGFARMCDLWPGLPAYATVYIIFAGSFGIAIFLYKTTTDRPPKNANFVKSGSTHHERLNYTNMVLWCYILFYVLWAGGRTTMFAFTNAYLLDQFHYSITKITLIFVGQYLVSTLMVLVMGKVTDRSGHRIWLIMISSFVACCMFLWVSSAWLGIVPIIIYFFLNGAAGQTHAMLAMNYGLEIFPDKGRSGYLAFTRFFIGGVSMVLSISAGKFLRVIEGWSYPLWGATLNHYHLLFIICTCITLGCTIPLMIAGKRTVTES